MKSMFNAICKEWIELSKTDKGLSEALVWVEHEAVRRKITFEELLIDILYKKDPRDRCKELRLN